MGKRSVLAADLGGTKCRYALVTEDLEVLGAENEATAKSREQLLANIDAQLAKRRRELPPGVDPPGAIGIGVAAMPLPDRDTLAGGPNLPLAGVRLATHLQAQHQLPVALLNDGRASAWGEALRGAAQGCDPLLALFFGTGIGIGLIVGGRPYEGATNAAGEIGHLIHLPNGRECVCGRRGCYEAYCGGGPISRRAAAELGPRPEGSTWTVGDVVAAAGREPAARQILADAELAACALVASACTLLNPAAVVLGGGVLKGWPELRDRIEAFVRQRCTPNVVAGLRFAASTAGADAILRGAARATGWV